MKIPCTINLDLGVNKQIVDDMIKRDGVSKDINQVGMEVLCTERVSGLKYSILQFNSSRNIVTISSRA